MKILGKKVRGSRKTRTVFGFIGTVFLLLSSLGALEATAAVTLTFYTNMEGARIDPSTLLKKRNNPQLQLDDWLDTSSPYGGELVVRTLRQDKSVVGAFPAFFGKAGYELRVDRWYTNPIQGGSLVDGNIYKDKQFLDLPATGKTNKELWLQWEPKANDKITLHYDTNSEGEVTAPADRTDKRAGEKFLTTDLPALKRKGYTFDGWYTQKVAGRQALTSLAPVTIAPDLYNGPTEQATLVKTELTLYAHWTKKSGTITVEFWDGSQKIESRQQDIQAPFASLPTLVQSDARFGGWWSQSGGQEATQQMTPFDIDNDIVAGNTLKLFAKWVQQTRITREWQMTDRTAVSPTLLSPKTEIWDVGARFDKDYTADVTAFSFTGLSYIGWQFNGGTVQSGAPNFDVVKNDAGDKITYIFNKKTYDLTVNYVDTFGRPLTPAIKRITDELTYGQDYVIDQSKLDVHVGKVPIGWYEGPPRSATATALKDMTTALPSAEITGEKDLTIVYESMIHITMPTSMSFRVSDAQTKNVQSKEYKVKNNSKYASVGIKLDTKQDVKVLTNPDNIQLIPKERTSQGAAEELYLVMQSTLPNFGEKPLVSENATTNGEDFTGVLGKNQEMSLTFKGQYYGHLPLAGSTSKKMEGNLIWHFSTQP